MQPDRNDPDIRAFIGASRAESFSALAAEIAVTFGTDRAWPTEWVADVFREFYPRGVGRTSQYERDAELMAFIVDRADTVSAEQLRREGIKTFGESRFPSRSHLYRLVEKVRIATRRKAIQAELAARAAHAAR